MKKVIVKNTLLILAATLLFASCTADVKSKEKEYVKTTEIPIIVRDFVPYNVEYSYLKPYRNYDFHNLNSNMEGDFVLHTLDKDKKPVFNEECDPADMNVQSPESFAQWFRTIDGVNKEIKTSIAFLPVNEDPYKYGYHPSSFFLIDNQGFGNDEDNGHNYNFTVESTFYLLYKKNLPITIRCSSDDDLWLFVNGKLLINLGNRHGYKTSEGTFDPKDYNAKPGDYIEVKLFKADRGTDVCTMDLSVSQDLYILK